MNRASSRSGSRPGRPPRWPYPTRDGAQARPTTAARPPDTPYVPFDHRRARHAARALSTVRLHPITTDPIRTVVTSSFDQVVLARHVELSGTDHSANVARFGDTTHPLGLGPAPRADAPPYSYARCATIDASWSCAAQHAYTRRVASDGGCVTVAEFGDEGLFGADLARPGLRALLRAAPALAPGSARPPSVKD